MWTGIFCILIVVTDGSATVKYITRYTEESFATLISVIFIVDGFKKMVHVHDKAPLGKVKTRLF
jgi:sodium bicarbonate cotransporter 7